MPRPPAKSHHPAPGNENPKAAAEKKEKSEEMCRIAGIGTEKPLRNGAL
jgi:hypothetical protein